MCDICVAYQNSVQSKVYPEVYNLLTVGQETIARGDVTSSGNPGSGVERLTFFTARKTELSTQSKMFSSTTVQTLATLVRWGLYEVASNGDGLLVAAIANDTSIFTVANTAYTRPWITPYNVIAGMRYALGLIVTTVGTMPTISSGSPSNLATSEIQMAPKLTGSLGVQADLLASFTNAMAAGSGSGRFYAAILP